MIVSKLKTKIKQIGVKNFVRDTFNTMTINKWILIGDAAC